MNRNRGKYQNNKGFFGFGWSPIVGLGIGCIVVIVLLIVLLVNLITGIDQQQPIDPTNGIMQYETTSPTHAGSTESVGDNEKTTVNTKSPETTEPEDEETKPTETEDKNLQETNSDQNSSNNDDSTGNKNNSSTGNNNSGSTGNNNSGSTGNNNSGSTGNNTSGSTGNNNSSSTGNNNSGSTGNNNSGSTGNNNSSSTGNNTSGSTGNNTSGSTGNDNSGSSGNNDSSSTGSGNNSSTTIPSEPELSKIEFPYAIPDTDLVIQRVAAYDGIYLEDGTNEETAGVAMMLLSNSGFEAVEYTNIILHYGEETLSFVASAVPAGGRVVVQAVNREGMVSGELTDCEVSIAPRSTLEMSESKVAVKDNGKNALTISNLTGEDIATVRVFYKYYMEDEATYVGGITYTAKISNLKAGASITVTPSHYLSDSSKVIMVRTYDTDA